VNGGLGAQLGYGRSEDKRGEDTSDDRKWKATIATQWGRQKVAKQSPEKSLDLTRSAGSVQARKKRKMEDKKTTD
jgi:hypothetical protein